jgi:hypothetical protein
MNEFESFICGRVPVVTGLLNYGRARSLAIPAYGNALLMWRFLILAPDEILLTVKSPDRKPAEV